jgi:hypothetical protein
VAHEALSAVVGVPMVVHVVAPTGWYWKATDASPEPLSVDVAVTVTVPLTVAPLAGPVMAAVGGIVSTSSAVLRALSPPDHAAALEVTV